MKIAVIGSNGYVGRNLSYYFKGKGLEVYHYDIQEKAAYDWMYYTALDVSKKDEFEKVPNDCDYVYFLSGITGTLATFEKYEDVVNVNLLGLLHFLDLLANGKFKSKIVFPSTRLVYEGSTADLDETAAKKTLTPYAATKLAGEELIRMYGGLYDLEYYIFRICVPYGHLVEAGYSYGTVGLFLNQIKANGVISLFGDGSQRRTFTYMSDLCEVLASACLQKLPPNETYNIGGENLELKQAAKYIADYFQGRVQFKEWPEVYKKIESGGTAFSSKKYDALMGKDDYVSLKTFLETESLE